jgi:hypothetical protein
MAHTGGPKRLDLVGQRFGMLLVKLKIKSDNKATRFLCLCDCGKTKVIVGSELKRGNNKSCGCNRTPRTTYEYRDHPLYDVWKGMKARCKSEKHISRKNYLDKGVKVCDLWENDFISFYDWAIENGWQDGLQLDKDIKSRQLGVDALYSPETCMWVTPAKNSQNRTGVKLNEEAVKEIRNSPLRRVELSRKYNLNVSTIDKIKQNKIWKV